MRQRRSRSRKAAKPSASKQKKPNGDSGNGCLVIFLVAWYFGFVTVNWHDSRDAEQRVADAEKQFKSLQLTLADSESTLTQLQTEINSTENELGTLASHKTSLEKQVAQIQSVRNNLQGDLSAISNVLEHGRPSGFWSFLQSITSGIVANILTMCVTAVCTYLITKRAMARKDESEPEPNVET